MDLKDTLEAIAVSQGWGFEYARRDYQNLVDVSDMIFSVSQEYADGETFMFVDPITRRPHETGVVYSGNLLILTNSDLDMGYEEKFEAYIRPMLDIVLKSMVGTLLCHYDLTTWRTLEVINFFDFNADGISIQYELKGY